MKINVKKDTHNGEQPIRVLKHNLTTRLVERNEEYIKSLQSDFKLNKNIKYHIANLPLTENQTPYIDENGTINIHETYLSYVWCVCYFFFVLHEEGVAIPETIKRNNPVHKLQNPELITEAKKLFDFDCKTSSFIDTPGVTNSVTPRFTMVLVIFGSSN